MHNHTCHWTHKRRNQSIPAPFLIDWVLDQTEKEAELSPHVLINHKRGYISKHVFRFLGDQKVNGSLCFLLLLLPSETEILIKEFFADAALNNLYQLTRISIGEELLCTKVLLSVLLLTMLIPSYILMSQSVL